MDYVVPDQTEKQAQHLIISLNHRVFKIQKWFRTVMMKMHELKSLKTSLWRKGQLLQCASFLTEGIKGHFNYLDIITLK